LRRRTNACVSSTKKKITRKNAATTVTRIDDKNQSTIGATAGMRAAMCT
jgi:hypothetical protein